MANKRKEFSIIYDNYIDKIYRFIFLKVNSQETAQDLSSETFLKCWQVYQENEKPGSKIQNIQAFLYKIARNLVIDYYREKGRAQVVSTEFTTILDPQSNFEEKAVLNSDIEQIRAVLAGLKEDYQNVIIWHYLDDLPMPEIAKLLDRTEEATRVLLHRALNSLREKIKSA